MPWKMAHRIGYQWLVHDNTSSAAAIAFYSLFTLAPTLVFGVAAGEWALGLDDARHALRNAMVDLMTAEQADALLSLVDGAGLTGGGVAASAMAGALLLYAASATFVQLRVALNRTFGYTAETIREQIHITIMGRLVAGLFVVLIGLLEVAVLALDIILSQAAARMPHWGWISVDALWLANHVISWLVIGLFFAGLLRYLPVRRPAWRHLLPGAAVSLILFEIGKYLIGLYLAHAAIASAYGAGSALVAIMLWIYYSSQTLLLGAEIANYRAVIEAEKTAPATRA